MARPKKQRYLRRFMPFFLIIAIFSALNTSLAKEYLPQPRKPLTIEDLRSVPPPPLSVKAAVLLDITSDYPQAAKRPSVAEMLIPPEKRRPPLVYLYELNADERRAPASLTKLLSALVAVEKIEASHRDYSRRAEIGGLEQREGNYLRSGDEITLSECLHEMMVFSDNGAAYALARAVGRDGYGGGGREAFVAEMNAYARRLGMAASHFSDPTGLPSENHYSTARDLAELSRAALKNGVVARLATTPNMMMHDPFSGRDVLEHNTNQLLLRYPGCYGLKTGYTEAAGYCLSAVAEKRGHHLLAVVLGGEEEDDRFTSAAILLDWGFRLLLPELESVK